VGADFLRPVRDEMLVENSAKNILRPVRDAMRLQFKPFEESSHSVPSGTAFFNTTFSTNILSLTGQRHQVTLELF
jgi:hypothetical protein